MLISSGAIAAGLAPLGLRRRPRDLAHQQAAAAVGQGLLMQRYTELFRERGILVGQVLPTVDDVTRQSTYANALRTLGTLLRMGVVPIINENDAVATHEIHFGDNDRLAALVAQLVRADALVLLSDVDALFTAHPDELDSLPITFVPDVEATDGRHPSDRFEDRHRRHDNQTSGRPDRHRRGYSGGARPGIAASAISSPANRSVPRLSPIDHRRPRRLLWLAHASMASGALHLDAGAVRAVTQPNASLLAAGITNVTGDFVAGDPVDLVTPAASLRPRPGQLRRRSAPGDARAPFVRTGRRTGYRVRT